MKSKIFFRADGNANIGLGHVIRSLALAEMLKEDFSCIFVTRFVTDYLRKEILSTCHSLIELSEDDKHYGEFLEILQGNEIVVLDNYFFDTNYQQTIKNKGCKLVCIDDIHDKHFVADVVINHAYGAQANLYSVEQNTHLYLGPEYALLRPAFLQAATTPVAATNNNLLICLGGADPNNDTLQILQELQQSELTYHYHLVVGSAYLHKKSLDVFLANTSMPITLHHNLSANEMLCLMQQCSQAILSPSTVALEYSCTRGTIFLKVIADNQKDVYSSMVSNHHALPYEAIYSNSSSMYEMRPIVDGHSNKKLLNIFKSLNINNITIRPAIFEDAQTLLSWANDPTVREQSFSTQTITYEEHIKWLTAKLSSPFCAIYIATYADHEVGMIRFDMDNNKATLSYLIAREQRGKGFGMQIVTEGIRYFTEKKNFTGNILAHVKQSNIASKKIFEKLNFEQHADHDYMDSILYSKTIR